MRLIFTTVGTSALRLLFGERGPLRPQPAPDPAAGDFDPAVVRAWSDRKHDAAAKAFAESRLVGAAGELGSRTLSLAAGAPYAKLGRPLHGTDVSAEINSLRLMLVGADVHLPSTTILLVGSDTRGGKFCSEVARDAIHGVWPEVHVVLELIPGLDPTNAARFQAEALPALARFIVDQYQSNARGGRSPDIVFNVTGGFKGILPFLGLIGLCVGASIQYLFEDSDMLVRLPTLQGNLKMRGGRIPKNFEPLFQVIGPVLVGGVQFIAPPTGP